MTKIFPADELKEIVKPYSIIEVLDSMLQSKLLTYWSWDYEVGEIELEIPANVEVQELMDSMQEMPAHQKQRRKV